MKQIALFLMLLWEVTLWVWASFHDETAAPIEVVWVSLSSLALVGHIYAGIDAELDRRDIVRSGQNSVLLFAAKGHIVMAAMLATVQACWLYVGIAAMTTSSPTASGTPSLQAIILISAFMFGELVLVALSFGTVWFRHQVRKMATEAPISEADLLEQLNEARELRGAAPLVMVD